MRWLESHQVALYLGALGAGALLGWLVPAADGLAAVVEPAIALLLFATFLTVPFRTIGASLRDVRFLVTVLAVNVVAVPVVVLLITRPIAAEPGLLVGAVLVLLAPCVDYVIAFCRIAGGAADRLLAVAPVLMVAQTLLIPPVLLLVAGPAVGGTVDPGPFVHAFVVLILLPLGAAVSVQLLAAVRGAPTVARTAAVVGRTTEGAMVPLMMLVLLAVVASQLRGIGDRAGELLIVVPVFVVFVLLMLPLGIVAGRIAGLRPAPTRAIVFSGVTRNSLVVLPLALAIPVGAGIVPLVVVTQTLVELVAMVVLVRLVPVLVPARTVPARNAENGTGDPGA
ncbi:MAG: arsenic resistance protein [Mycetocola reblochoni]|uniref:arsenic resistance protein n=1 Tax=Mycetocola reblochoni TaxID=331618 RepID=UPI003B8496C4